jgi:hypothetical protein
VIIKRRDVISSGKVKERLTIGSGGGGVEGEAGGASGTRDLLRNIQTGVVKVIRNAQTGEPVPPNA